jgi:hypothetical protein
LYVLPTTALLDGLPAIVGAEFEVPVDGGAVGSAGGGEEVAAVDWAEPPPHAASPKAAIAASNPARQLLLATLLLSRPDAPPYVWMGSGPLERNADD